MISAVCFLHILISAAVGLTELATEPPNPANNHAQRREIAKRFADLLQDLVQINEKRFKAMKQLVQLQDSSVFELTSRPIEVARSHFIRNLVKRDAHKTEDSTASIVLLFKGEQNPTTRSRPQFLVNEDTETKTSSALRKDDCHFTDDESGEGFNIARSIDKHLSKHGVKYCKKACKDALKNVCYDYSCSRSMKRHFKKECKGYCKEEFHREKYSD